MKTLRYLRQAGAVVCLSTVCAWAIAAPAALPFKQSDAQDDGLMARALLGFVCTSAAALGIAYGIKRWGGEKWGGPPRAAAELRKVGTLRLTGRSTLFLVRYGEQELLLADSERGLHILVVQPAAMGTL